MRCPSITLQPERAVLSRALVLRPLLLLPARNMAKNSIPRTTKSLQGYRIRRLSALSRLRIPLTKDSPPLPHPAMFQSPLLALHIVSLIARPWKQSRLLGQPLRQLASLDPLRANPMVLRTRLFQTICQMVFFMLHRKSTSVGIRSGHQCHSHPAPGHHRRE